MRRIEVLDTTLRDGNKLPFVVLTAREKLQLARRLADMGVDVIEAGQPALSPEESECVSLVAAEVEGTAVSACARALEGDTERALDCLRGARIPYLHVFMPVSPWFLNRIMKKSAAESLREIGRCVRLGKEAGVKVQFSLSEAPHADPGFMADAVAAACEAGVDVLSAADTNGILMPADVTRLLDMLRGLTGRCPVPPVLGVHCHNDLGLATANTLAAVEAGATHVETTIGGFGARAGNAALEEIAFLLEAFAQRLDIEHGLRLDGIRAAAETLDRLTGLRTHPNKPVIGRAALMEGPSSGARRSMDPSIAALLSQGTIGTSPHGEGAVPGEPEPFRLESFTVTTGSHSLPVAGIRIEKDGLITSQSSHGSGPIDALFHAVDKALGLEPRLTLYSVATLSMGTDAEADVTVTVEHRGKRFHGHAKSRDVIEASLRAYVGALGSVAPCGELDPAEFYVQGENLWE